MSSILDYYHEEELKKEYEEMLDNKKAVLYMLNDINKLIGLIEHYFETGEVSQELLDIIEEEDDDE